MAQPVKLPPLGENVEEAEVLTVLVAPGQRVERDQALLELETDKATVEVPAPEPGVVTAIHVKPGDRVRPGQVIAEIEVGAQPGAGGASAGASAAAPGEEAPPPAGPEPASGTGPEPPGGAPAASASRPPAAEPRAAAPAPPERPAETGRAAQPPSAAAAAGAAPEAAPHPGGQEASSAEPAIAPPYRPEPLAPPVPAAPSVRRLARELGVDVAEVGGTGPGGRVTVEDVKRHVRELLARGAVRGGAAAPPAGVLELPDFSAWGEVERERLSAVRRRIAENMSRSWLSIPHVTQFDRADVTELDATRRRYAPRVAEAGGKLTVTAIAIKVVAAAVRRFPKFNASLDLHHEEVVYKKFVNVGVAVDTDYGLVVPVIRDADRKNLVEIGTELTDLSDRARRRKVRPEELRGATISVTNLGGLGTTYFSPLINWPEVSVVGLGRAAPEAVWKDDAFVPRLVLPLSVSYDHRLIDGADAARFLRWIAEAMETPLLLSLEG